MDSIVAANSKFSLDLFKKISAVKKTDNVFYSPLSISSALAMVYVGAWGNTAKQMAEVLGFIEEREPKVKSGMLHTAQQAQLPEEVLETLRRADDDKIHAGFKELMSALNKEGAPYALSLANRLYGQRSFNFEEEYIVKTKKFYQAKLKTVDFISSAEAARVDINSWVEKKTQEKIKDLLAKGTIDSLTRLVLVNAIYFKGNWDRKFDEKDTKEMQFRLSKNERKPVQMMHKKTKFRYAFIPEVKCKVLEMPYKDKELSLLILLPEEIEDDSTGLTKLEGELTYGNLIQWTQPANLRSLEVKVALPKFKMEDTYDLKEILISMGMEDAFDVSSSDFSGMSSSNELVLSKVVHKSFVEVNEEGTEAAAATAGIMMMRSASIPIPPETFIADHPFLFFIRHNSSQSILFFGRFCSP